MKRVLLFIYFLFFVILLPAQQENTIRISRFDSTETIKLNKYWKFHNGDDSVWASPLFSDSSWDTINTLLKFDKNDSTPFRGIAWFRLHLYIDSGMNNTPIYLYIEQQGASQFFIDGRLLYSVGKVATNSLEEKKYNPRNIPFTLFYSHTGEHILAIRYSNTNYRQLHEKYDLDKSGFSIYLTNQEYLFQEYPNNTVIEFLLVSLGIFFITLGFIHFLFFLFYKKQRSNLYYSAFVGLLGLLFILPSIMFGSLEPERSLKIGYYYWFVLLFFFYSMLVLNYSLYKRPLNKYFWFSTVLLILTIGLRSEGYGSYVFISFITSTVIASFFIVIKSIIKKVDGAWIIGIGSLFFLLFILLILIITMFNSGFSITLSLSDGILNLVLFILILLAIMSIPISMSVYLARDFAKTSKNLSKKLIEVETLSARTLEQEKEKQKILETQKEVLELQVNERTAEIVEQKTIIEKKNKDITDSINYAKNIQEAILPTKELKNKIFPNAFILFKPKDIVSGDFYWFTEKNGKKIIASCDCTGHGVPGALMSMIGNNLLNQIVNEKGITTPGEILNNLHKEIRKALKQEEQTETKDGMDIAVITFDSKTEIEFAGAQRPLWIIAPPNLSEIKGNKFSIGGLQSEKERIFTNHIISITKGTTFYIFSDGYADQFSDTDKKLMTSRFKQLILDIQHQSMAEQEQFLADYIEKWRGKREQIDDILVIGIRV